MPISPGPAAHESKSTLGPQFSGKSEPMWAFGTSQRFSEPAKDGANRPSAYDLRGSLGSQLEGKCPTQPAYSMGTSTRKGVEKVFVSDGHATATFAGVGSPGPATYMGAPGLGKQASSQNETPPTWLFGSLERFKKQSGLNTPAPGTYVQPSAVGPQVNGRYESAPLPGFGTSTREHMTKVFMSPSHEKTKSFGKASPGPQYSLQPSVGQQTLSSKRTSPAR